MTNGGRPRRLLLCEGPDDREFFRALIEVRNLPRFRVRYNGTPDDATGGNTKFGPGLRAHYKLQGGLRRFDQVLVVSDNDDNPAQSFERVRSQVEACLGFAPQRPREFAQGPPTVMILMIPADNTPGNLESLCLEAAEKADPKKTEFVNQFAAQVRVDDWKSDCRKQEMKLRSNLAARCERDPFVTLRNAFTEPKHSHLIPLDDSSFGDIADVLAGFNS